MPHPSPGPCYFPVSAIPDERGSRTDGDKGFILSRREEEKEEECAEREGEKRDPARGRAERNKNIITSEF